MIIVTVRRLTGLILAIALAGTLIACGGTSAEPASSTPASGVGVSGEGTPATAGGSDYRAIVTKEHDDIARSYNRFRGLMTNAQPTDMKWRTSVHLQLVTWRTTYSEAQKLTPPPDLADFHQAFTAGLEKFDSAADDMTVALDAGSIDVSQFESSYQSATVKLTDGVRLLEGATQLLGNQ